ncbi:UNVERIFIED_CONTAM: rlmH [Trichonephila clavipes]
MASLLLRSKLPSNFDSVYNLHKLFLPLNFMKIRILTIGQKMPAWVLTGFEDYFKRIQPFVQTQVIELPMAKRGKNDSEADILKYCQIEGESILNALKPNETLIALEVGGRELSTEKLADTMKQWMLDGNDIALAIGGPDGHSDALRKAAAWHWSLSKLTMPHPMVRILLIEQLYRAMSINHNHPYHRA